MAFVYSLFETQPAAASGTRAKAMIAPNVLRICGLLGRRAWRSASDPLWQRTPGGRRITCRHARWTRSAGGEQRVRQPQQAATVAELAAPAGPERLRPRVLERFQDHRARARGLREAQALGERYRDVAGAVRDHHAPVDARHHGERGELLDRRARLRGQRGQQRGEVVLTAV